MNIIDFAEKRYAVKKFDPEKKIDADTYNSIEKLLVKSPSSINLQPWHYIAAQSENGKKLIAESASGPYSYNRSKIIDSSHVFVFCSKRSLEDSHLDMLLKQEGADGRFKNDEAKEMQHGVKFGFSNIHRNDLKDADEWMKRQVYLSLGFFLLGASALGVDVCPMEGFDSVILDKVLGLEETGYRSLVLAAAGYSSSDDFNASLPKSRLPVESVISRI